MRAKEHLYGDIAELGVYKGGNALRMIKNASAGTWMHLFDTFTGIPERNDSIDWHKIGDFGDISFLDVVRSFNGKDVRFYVGKFEETRILASSKRFACVHLDADQYDVTKLALEFFYPRMVRGGAIFLDDYKWPHCPGVEKALHEFMDGKPEKIESWAFEQAVIVKS